MSKCNQEDKLYADAFRLLISGKCAVVWGCFDQLSKAPQENWGEIIVKASCKQALEIAQMNKEEDDENKANNCNK